MDSEYPSITINQEQRDYCYEQYKDSKPNGRLNNLDEPDGAGLTYKDREQGFLAEICIADFRGVKRPAWNLIGGDGGWDQKIFGLKTDVFLRSGNTKPQAYYDHKLPSSKFRYNQLSNNIPTADQLSPNAQALFSTFINHKEPNRLYLTGLILTKDFIDLYRRGCIRFVLHGHYVVPYGRSWNNTFLIPFSFFRRVRIENNRFVVKMKKSLLI